MLRLQLCLAALLVVALGTQAYAGVIRVPGDQPTIQQGIDAASEGDTVLVAPGTYTGLLNRRLDFGGVNIRLMSEAGPEATVIDCEHTWPNIWLRSGEDASSLIQGFTICNGYGGDCGAGIWCQGASPAIRECIFENCYAWGAGGGLHVSEGASILLEDVVFRNNGAQWNGGGACFSTGSHGVLTRCLFEDNYATPPGGGQGGGLSCFGGGSFQLTDCVFVRNAARLSGCGAYFAQGEAYMTRCTFIDNVHEPAYGTGQGGALALWDCTGQATDCTFVGNKAYMGGGAYVWSWSEPVSFSFVGCTFVLCGASLGAGILVDGPAIGVVDRTIIAFSDHDNAVRCEGEGSFLITCSDFYGSTGQDWPPCVADQLGVSGNISSDPLFCDLAGLDLTLHEDSPCAPVANPDCGLIGAWEVGCGITSVLPTTWGTIKAFYRGE